MSTLFDRFQTWLRNAHTPLFTPREFTSNVAHVEEKVGEAFERDVLVLTPPVKSCSHSVKPCKTCPKVHVGEIKEKLCDDRHVETPYQAKLRLAYGQTQETCNMHSSYAVHYLNCAWCQDKPATLEHWWDKMKDSGHRLETADEALLNYRAKLPNSLIYQLETRRKVLPALSILTAQMCDDENAMTHVFTLIEIPLGECSAQEFKKFRDSVAWLTTLMNQSFVYGAPAVMAAQAHFEEGKQTQEKRKKEDKKSEKKKKKRKKGEESTVEEKEE